MKTNRAQDIEYELSARKSASRRRLNAHIENVGKTCPAVLDKKAEIAETSVEFAEKIIASPADSEELKKLAKEVISRLEVELESLLSENGFPADYLEEKPICPVCSDKGFVDGELCVCIKKLIIEKRFKGSGLNPLQTFETISRSVFDDPRDNRIRERICSYLSDYADSFPENELPDLLLYGDPGVGKTFLLNAIGCRVLARGYSVLRMTANRLVNETLECISERKEKPDLVLPDLLILDDLGTEPMIPNVTVETLLAVICERQDSGKPTLFATNLDLDAISEEYGARVWSRLVSPQRVKVIKMTTPSIRLKKV